MRLTILKILAVVMLLLAPSALVAQQMKSFHNAVPNNYNFWIYTPEGYDTVEASRGIPLFVFLHGQSICGNNLDRVRRYGPLTALERGMRLEGLVLAPQNPGGPWKPAKVMELVEWVQQHYAVDASRIYVLGMSLGGYGTIDFVGTYPHKVAAAMALCGGGTIKDYCGLNEVPLWIMHGTGDKAVSVSASQKVVDAMRRCGSGDRLIFTKLPGYSHSALARAFYIEETYDWLLSHTLADEGRVVNRGIEITPSQLQRAYKGSYRNSRGKGNVAISGGNAKKMPVLASGEAEESVADSLQTPVAKVAAKTSTGVQYHTIRQGDTLGKIAKRYHTTVNKLCRINNMKSTATLRIGRKIKVHE